MKTMYGQHPKMQIKYSYIRIFLFSCCLFANLCVHAQLDNENDTAYWWSISDLADSIAGKLDTDSVHSFTQVNKERQKEFWRYDTVNDSLFQFKIIYYEKGSIKAIKRTEYDEYFLVLNHQLVYEQDGYTDFYPAGDSMRWSEEGYYRNERGLHFISHGHGISETDDYNPERDILLLFKKRYKQLQSYLKKHK